MQATGLFVRLISSASLIAVAVPAAAQAVGQPAAATASADQPASDEIIVTATLRAENLQDVPLAVSAFNAESLERAGVRDLRQLDNVSASFNLSNSQTESGGTTLRVRGVGTTGNNTGLESSVGIFLDGVYLSRPGIALGDLLDVTQVEVLRGPQGTLFGRNTSAGALNIRTARPNLDRLDGFANATYGNYDLFNVQAGVSAPIVPGAFAVRLSGAYRKQDGTVTSTTGATSNNRDRYIIRGQALYAPTDDFSVRVIADYQKSDEKCCDAVILQDTTLRFAGLYAAAGLPANGGVSVFGPEAQEQRISNGQQFFDRSKQWGVSAEINARVGEAELVSITGYRWSRSGSVQESDYVGLNVYGTSNRSTTSTANSAESFTRIATFTQELRLSGGFADDRVQYILGGYYSDERIREVQSITLGRDFQQYISAGLKAFGVPGINPARDIFAGGVSAEGNYGNNLFTQHAKNWSLFGNATWNITDVFGINAGLRYSDDWKRGAFTQLSASSPACAAVIANNALGPLAALKPLATALTCFPFTTSVNLPTAGLGTPAPFNRVFKDDQLIWTVKATLKPSDAVNAYASFTRGYKAGGFNLDPTAAALPTADPRFRSETVDAYEIGLKTRTLDGALTANLALFHQDISDFQVLEFTGTQFVTFNVDKARSTGFELELVGRVTPELTANASLTYADARYPKDCAGTSTNPIILTLCGNDLTNAPKYVAIAGFDYNRPFGNGLEFGFNGSVKLESDRRTSTQANILVGNQLVPNPFDIQDSNVKANLRVGIGAEDGLWRIELFGNNIFDVQTRSITANVPLRGGTFLPGALGANGAGVARLAFLQEPRSYGVTLRTRF